MKLPKKKSTLVFAIIGIVLGLILISNIFLFRGIRTEDIQEILAGFGPWAPIVYLILFTIVPLTFFPDSVLAMAGGIAFGVKSGFILALTGAILGSGLAFFLTRRFGRKYLQKYLSTKEGVSTLSKQIERKGFIVILLLRLTPVPFDIISYAAGLSSVRYRDFLFATILGAIPAMFSYVNFGDKITAAGSSEFYLSIGLMAALLLIGIIIRRTVDFDKLGDRNHSKHSKIEKSES
jgi:uncharacterized membrane protein YdjX (TVP38/TMEM64 family)